MSFIFPFPCCFKWLMNHPFSYTLHIIYGTYIYVCMFSVSRIFYKYVYITIPQVINWITSTATSTATFSYNWRISIFQIYTYLIHTFQTWVEYIVKVSQIAKCPECNDKLFIFVQNCLCKCDCWIGYIYYVNS